MNKPEKEQRKRGSRERLKKGRFVRYIGIDIGSEKHVVAAVDADGGIVLKPLSFSEDAEGYASLFTAIGDPEQALVVMEATGHYWKNLFVALSTAEYAVAVVNPLRTSRFADEDLARTKTDAADAVMLSRFGCEKRPQPSRVADEVFESLKELGRFRARMLREFGDKTRQLHRLVDLCFPEFTRLYPTLSNALVTTMLHRYPSARMFANADKSHLARISAGSHQVGRVQARLLIETAKKSVGQHDGDVYALEVRCLCEDLAVLRSRLAQLDKDIDERIASNELAQLLQTIPGLGSTSVARILGEAGDPSAFASGAAFAAYLGVVPGLRQSGKRTSMRASVSPRGHAALRSALWMPTLAAVQKNPWLRAFYERQRSRGKPFKVALTAALHKLALAIYSVALHRKPFVPRLAE